MGPVCEHQGEHHRGFAPDKRRPGKICGKPAVAMTPAGRLFCEEHAQQYEHKWDAALPRIEQNANS